MHKIFGKVEDYSGNPLSDADILIKNEKFEDVYSCKSNPNGCYEVNVQDDTYFAIGIFKDYKTKYLEYWAWNVKVDKDIEIDAKIDALEVYGMNAFIVQGAFPAISIYFRPMSLLKLKKLEAKEDLQTMSVIDIAPKLDKAAIKAVVNNEQVRVLNINKITEYVSANQSMYGYIVQIDLPNDFDKTSTHMITLDICDIDTKEKGMGSVCL